MNRGVVKSENGREAGRRGSGGDGVEEPSAGEHEAICGLATFAQSASLGFPISGSAPRSLLNGSSVERLSPRLL